jgi:hypothetical protein
MKVKEFLVDFKNKEILNVKDLELSNELENEYVNLLNEFFSREVEDRDIVLEDLDKKNGFLYELMWEWFENEFVEENDLGLCWYEYSLEDLFRDTFCIEGDIYKLFKLKDINKKLYGDEDDYDEE